MDFMELLTDHETNRKAVWFLQSSRRYEGHEEEFRRNSVKLALSENGGIFVEYFM